MIILLKFDGFEAAIIRRGIERIKRLIHNSLSIKH